MLLLEDPSLALRTGMRRLAASVCVITTIDAVGQRQAMTATSVTSVSDDPASLLVCVNRHAGLYDTLAQKHRFAVNILSAQHADISARCAGQETGESRFAVGDWGDALGLPYLRDAQAVFFCHTARHLVHGTHLIVIGNVDKALITDHDTNPLLYADGRYRHLSH